MKDLLDLTNSKLVLQGEEEERNKYKEKIESYEEALKPDLNERKSTYQKRRDFYIGNQGEYSNITGIVRDVKSKKGHVNQITNYAGKTCTKIAYGLANNPPKVTIPPIDAVDPLERTKAQAVQNFIEKVLKDNYFWKKTYRRCVFNQVVVGDAAFMTMVDSDEKKITISPHDDMGTLMVGWNGYDPDDFDFVIAELYLTPEKIEEDFGIKVNEKALPKMKVDQSGSQGSWNQNEWATKTPSKNTNSLPSSKNNLPKLKVVYFDSAKHYCIKIEGEMVQFIYKDDQSFPALKFWTIVKNIPNPPSNWSISDIDYLIDPQIEINDNDNRTADYLRVGGVQRYVAYNMGDFDPESIKTSSGQVIFVNDPDGRSKFEPLQTNINNFPSDQYANRKMSQLYDMGLPKVNYGASGADSGRSKAIDYQSSIDLTIFKRDSWELALQDLIHKIQVFGHFIYPEFDWFTDDKGEFIVRDAEFDWNDIMPITQSDKIVNVANKFSMIGIPFEQAYKELGYRDPKAMVETLKAELADPDLMTLRSKMWQVSEGLLQAQNQAATMAQSMNPVTPEVNQPSATLTPEANTENSKPMAGAGTTSYSSPAGMIDKARQNMGAQGR